MSDMPRTIWASDSPTSECVISFPTPSEGYPIEYRRADLIPLVEPQVAKPQPTGLTLIEIDGVFINPATVRAVTPHDINRAYVWLGDDQDLALLFEIPIAEVVALLTGKGMNDEW